MKANRIAMLGLAVLLGSTVYGNVSVIKAENDQLEEGLDAIEDAIGKGKDSDSENNSQSASEGETDMQEGTSDNTIGTPDDFPAAYDFGSGKISDFSRDYMLKKMSGNHIHGEQLQLAGNLYNYHGTDKLLPPSVQQLLLALRLS